MLPQHSPNQLAFLRKQHGLSQKQLAALLGQERAIISMYEHGHVLPTLSSAGMFQLLFGKDIAEIFPALFEELERELEQNRYRLERHLAERATQL